MARGDLPQDILYKQRPLAALVILPFHHITISPGAGSPRRYEVDLHSHLYDWFVFYYRQAQHLNKMVSASIYFTFLVAGLSSLVSAVPRPKINDAPVDATAGRRRGCGVHITDQRVSTFEKKYQAHRLAPESENSTATLDIYFHVIYANETIEGGYIP